MTYLWLKALHVLAAVVFLGNIYTGLFWASRARRARDFKLLQHTFASIIRSDRYFTNPGVIVLVASGIGAALLAKISLLSTGWIFWSLVLISLSGAVFGLRLVPLQRQLAALCASAQGTEDDWREFEALYRSWKWWGDVALLAPFVAAVLMVLKPALPAL